MCAVISSILYVSVYTAELHSRIYKMSLRLTLQIFQEAQPQQLRIYRALSAVTTVIHPAVTCESRFHIFFRVVTMNVSLDA